MTARRSTPVTPDGIPTITVGRSSVRFFRPADEVREHGSGGIEIGDDPVAERPRGDNLSGGPSDHAFGFLAHRDDLAIVRPLGDHGRLAQDDALALDVDQRVGRPQINPQVATEPVK